MESASPSPSSIFNPRRILVRGVNWLGDAVMTTPALRRLRERFPAAHIALLTPEKLRELWRHHPAVDEAIPLASGENVFSVGRRLRAGNFDLAVVLPNSPRSALETWLARIPQRIGYARPWRNWFLTRTVVSRPDAVKMRKRSVSEIQKLIESPSAEISNFKFQIPNSAAHQLHEYLHLAAALGANPEPLAPELFVSPEEVEAAREKFSLTGVAGPILALNAGAEYGPAKRWPALRFAAAADYVQRLTHCVWLILGGKGEDESIAGVVDTTLRAITEGKSARINVAGKTSLRELMALLKNCRVLLTNDTGPMHVAAALGVPVVVPFGSTSPELTGPGLPGDRRHRLLRSNAPCSPCFRRECPIDLRCMTGIEVERVAQAVVESMKGV